MEEAETNEDNNEEGDEDESDETQLDENNNVSQRGPPNMLKSTFGFDLIVCGNCQADFRLANLNEFIEHKIQKCTGVSGRNRAGGRLFNKRSQSKFLLAGLAAAANWGNHESDNQDNDEGKSSLTNLYGSVINRCCL